jgi:hypothetical protein
MSDWLISPVASSSSCPDGAPRLPPSGGGAPVRDPSPSNFIEVSSRRPEQGWGGGAGVASVCLSGNDGGP